MVGKIGMLGLHLMGLRQRIKRFLMFDLIERIVLCLIELIRRVCLNMTGVIVRIEILEFVKEVFVTFEWLSQLAMLLLMLEMFEHIEIYLMMFLDYLL